MKNLLRVSDGGLFASGFVRMTFSLLLLSGLAAGLWVITLHSARARSMAPAEMIQEGLPPGKSMARATKPEFLSAVCAAVKRHRDVAAEIAKVAVAAHREYAGDIVATVLRCSSSVDCDFVGTIVSAAIRVAQSEASIIDDAALAIAPDCADAIQAATERAGGGGGGGGVVPGGFASEAPFNQVPLPGSISGGGGGGFNPQEQVVLVCDNGTQRTVPESQLAEFLNSHPGSFVGACQPTPSTNR